MHQEDKIQKFTFGKAVFKNMSGKIKKNIQNKQDIQLILKSNQWNINNEFFRISPWSELFPNMIECQAESISLDVNFDFQIISQIQYARYTKLKLLSLNRNYIQNIQPLSSIHFQCLQELNLSCNEISQIKCLNRLSTPSLYSIQIELNPLIQINALTRSKINFKQSTHLSLSLQRKYRFQPFQEKIHQDLSVLVKLNSKSAQNFYIQSMERIKQLKVQNMLKLRFLFLNIQN